MNLKVIKLSEARRGLVLLPRRWVVESTFAWQSRFRRLARDYERLPGTLASLHWPASVFLMLNNLFQSAYHALQLFRAADALARDDGTPLGC